MKKCKLLRESFIISVLAMSFLLFPIISVAATDAKPQYGGVMKVIEFSEGGQPIGTPWKVRGNDNKLLRPAIDSLLRGDNKGNYYPWLATSWDIDMKNNTITLPLRKGVKFHDGTDFNAEAAKFCLEQAIASKVAPGFISVDVVDDYKIRINVDRYKNNMLYLLESQVSGMVSPSSYKQKGKEWAEWHPVGTGPFKFVSFERGNLLKYEKWDGYWQEGKPYLDGIEFPFIRDPMTQQAVMRSKGDDRVHVLALTSGEQAAMLKAIGGLNIVYEFVGSCMLIPDSINADSPLSNHKVRQAISYAINREAIVKSRGFGFWEVATQNPPPGFPGYVEGSPLGEYNPEKAKQLLAEAGYRDGFKINLYVMPGVVDRDAMVAVQNFLSKVGINVELDFPDRGKYAAMRLKEGWKNGFLSQNTRTLATLNIGYTFYYGQEGGVGQLPSLKRPEGFLEKLEASLVTIKPEPERMQELTQMMIDEVMVIPLYHYPEIFVLQNNVHDSGYGEWSSSVTSTPEKVWLSK